MDLKTAPARYAELAAKNAPSDGRDFPAALARSAELIRSSGIEYEFRSLLLPRGWFTARDEAALAPLAGGGAWVKRPFVPGNCLDPAWNVIMDS